MQFTAAIIGLGNIGMGYDYYSNKEDSILTHAKALKNHPGFKLVGGVDKDSTKRTAFQEKYRLMAYPDIATLTTLIKPMMYTLAVPCKIMHEIFLHVLEYQPKIILCEKPFANSTEQANEMLQYAKSQNCKVVVNYIRRFDPGVLVIKKVLAEKKIGKIKKVDVSYCNGLLNNGAHYINLVQFLFGEVCDISQVHYASLESPDFDLFIDDIKIHFSGYDNLHYDFHEMNIVAEDGIIRYQNSGEKITLQIPHADETHQNYQTLSDQTQQIQIQMDRYQWYVYEHIFNDLNANATSLSDGESALTTLQIIENILNGNKLWNKN